MAQLLIIVIQTNGKIIVAGEFSRINGVLRPKLTRLNGDGSVDVVGDSLTTIGGSGGFLRNRLAKLNVNGDVEFIVVQVDEKTPLGVSFTQVGGIARNKIARLNLDGSVDSSFEPNSNRRIKTIALTLNGDILIGGGPIIVGPHQKRLACGLTG